MRVFAFLKGVTSYGLHLTQVWFLSIHYKSTEFSIYTAWLHAEETSYNTSCEFLFHIIALITNPD